MTVALLPRGRREGPHAMPDDETESRELVGKVDALADRLEAALLELEARRQVSPDPPEEDPDGDR